MVDVKKRVVDLFFFFVKFIKWWLLVYFCYFVDFSWVLKFLVLNILVKVKLVQGSIIVVIGCVEIGLRFVLYSGLKIFFCFYVNFSGSVG